MVVLGEFLLALASQMDALNVLDLLSWMVLKIPDLEGFVKPNENVSARGLEESTLGVRDALGVTQDAVVVLLPHVDIRCLDLVLDIFFHRSLGIWGLSIVVRLILVAQDYVKVLCLQVDESNSISVKE